MKSRVQIVVSGMVQGVGFRYFTLRRAQKMGLGGYVKNLPDGQVLCEAEGEPGLLMELIRELRIGPSFSDVRDLDVQWFDEFKDYQNFQVRF